MGRAIGSRYELDDEIGRGAFGAVWRGRVRSSGEAVAIKVLLEEFAADADVVTRFLRERTALVGLNHRSLVKLRDLVVEGDILALVMQLVEGPDLKKYLASRSRLDAAEAGLLVAEVSEGLAVAHSAGIVHRDIKPANVLLAQSDGGLRPLLTDFGIARIADAPSVTRTHQVVGTPYYLAPEVVAGKKATPAADIYASGVMLYELITGHPVFRGPDAVSVFRQHMNTVPERPAEIPTRIWPVISACLAKEPEARPSALVLAAQLRAAIGRTVTGPDGEPTHHLPVEERYGTLRLPPIRRPEAPLCRARTGRGRLHAGPARADRRGVGRRRRGGCGSGGRSRRFGACGGERRGLGRHTVRRPRGRRQAGWGAPASARSGWDVPVRPADGRIAGWDAPSEPDAIGAGTSRRPANTQPLPQRPAPTQALPPVAPYPQNRQPNPQQQQQAAQNQRLNAYPPQPQYAPQQYQQPGYQGAPPQDSYQRAPQHSYQRQDPYQRGPGAQDPYQQQHAGPQGGPTQFQGNVPAPPRPVAYTPNQPPVIQRPPQQDRREQQPQVVQKTVVKHRVVRLGCLIKLLILAAIAFGVYTGVNWVTYKINHFDLNHWVNHQWNQIWSNITSKKKTPTLPGQ